MNKKVVIGLSSLVLCSIIGNKIHSDLNTNYLLPIHNINYKTEKQKYNEFKEIVKVANEERLKKEEQKMKELELATEKQRLEDQPIVYDVNNLTLKSNLTYKRANTYLKGTGLEGLENAFIQAENQYSVNAIFLIGLAANESSWGNSNRATNQNNLTGYAVYDRSSRGGEFSSKEESILKTAKMLSENYLNPNGEHFNGLGLYDVNIKYCQDGSRINYHWSQTINSICKDIKYKFNNK